MKSKRNVLISEIKKMQESAKNIDLDKVSKEIEEDANRIAKQMYKNFNQIKERNNKSV